MKWASFVLAYHGCDRAVSEQVFSGKAELKASKNDYDWLGTGIYFWEGSPQRALDWAALVTRNPKMSRSKITEPSVVGAVVDLGNCLDLLEAESIKLVEQAHLRFGETLAKAGAELPANKTLPSGVTLYKLDCAVINALHSFREDEGKAPFDTVRAAITEGTPLYPHSNFRNLTHVQLCVRDPGRIVAYFRPKTMAV